MASRRQCQGQCLVLFGFRNISEAQKHRAWSVRSGTGVEGGLPALGSRLGSRGALGTKNPVTTRKTGQGPSQQVEKGEGSFEGLRASIITSRKKSIAGAPRKLLQKHRALSGKEVLTCACPLGATAHSCPGPSLGPGLPGLGAHKSLGHPDSRPMTRS